MAEDFLEQAFPSEPAEEAAAPEVIQEQEVTAQMEPESKAPEPVPQVEKSDRGNVSLDAFLNMRDKAREAERRATELEARQKQQAEVPDPYDDPQAFGQYQSQQIHAALQKQKMDISWELATEKHGLEPVTAAKDWALEKAQTDPVFHAKLETAMNTQVLPIDWIVREHKKDGLLSDIGDNVDDWFTREAAKRGYVSQTSAPVAAPVPVVAAPPAAPKPAKVPQSLATQGSGPSDVGHVPSGPLVGLEAFK